MEFNRPFGKVMNNIKGIWGAEELMGISKSDFFHYKAHPSSDQLIIISG
jgi:hypothetical protein